jgi:4-hydroxybenzoate polyprenyltransferase
MESIFDLSVFLGATFAAAVVAGVAGFAFALIAVAVWLHILPLLQVTTLIIAFGLIVQGFAVKLDGRLNEAGFRKLILVLLLVSGVTLVL